MSDAVYALPENVREALLRYLSGRPYAEVAEAINVLHTLDRVVSINGSVDDGAEVGS